MGDSKIVRQIGRFYFYAIFLAYAIVILSSRHAPLLQDYPDWVYQGVLFQHLISGHLDAGYVFHTFPVPNSLTTVALGMLNFLLGWVLAAKVWIVMLFGFAIYAMRRLEKALDQSSGWSYFLAPALVVFNMSFWTGNINFQFSVCLVLLWVAILVENRDRQIRNYAWPTALLSGIFFCHMIACAVSILFLFFFVMQTRQYRLLLATLPSGILTIWYKIGLTAAHVAPDSTADGAVRYASPAFVVYKVNGYFKALGCTNVVSPGDHSSLTLTLLRREGFILMVLLYVVLGACFLVLCWKGYRRRGLVQRNLEFLWRALLVLAVLSIVAPPFWGGVFNPGYRLLQLAIAVSVFLVMPASAGTSRRLVEATVVIAAICGVLNVMQFAAIQRKPLMQGALDREIPERIVTQLTWVAPAIRLGYYEDLTKHVMTRKIFESALFHEAR